MNIQLVDSIVNDMSLIKTNEPLGNMDFSFVTAFSEESLNTFAIIFDLKIQVGDEHILTIKYISEFKSDTVISKEDRDSHGFFSINAPAIAFPFLRAYIANFMLSSGFNPLILPAINFVKLAEDRKTNQEKTA